MSERGGRHNHSGYEFCDGPHCQVFKSIPHDGDVALEQALASVRGVYLSYHGRPIAAFYHHSCGGVTSRVEDVWPMAPEPYLVAVPESPNSSCRLGDSSKWSFAQSRKSLASCFRKAKWLNAQEALDTIKVVRNDPSGRAKVIMIQGNRTLLIPVGKLRNVINQYYGTEVLRSAMFTITRVNDQFVFKGRGWGHGVGLCQEGAMWMARHGKTYQEILNHYFPQTKFSHLK
jgi:stage II sporulation protein D